jgi:hypothetical protein
MEKEIPLENSGILSGHVHQMCGNADKIYTSAENLQAISQGSRLMINQFLILRWELSTLH